jgi:putative ABC transport system permease protein
LILYNMTVAKTHEIALLKLMGARTRVVVGMILQQSLMLGGIGYAMALDRRVLRLPALPAPRRRRAERARRPRSCWWWSISVVASLAGIVRALRIPPTIVLAG